MKNLIFLSLLTFVFVSCGTAQQGYSVSSKKAVNYFEAGLQQPRIGLDPRTGGPDYQGGIELIKKALEKEPNFWEAHAAISEFYELTRNNKAAIFHLEESLRLNPNQTATGAPFYFLANLLRLEGRYEESNQRIAQYMTYRQANPDMQAAARNMEVSNDFAINAMKNPVPYDPRNVGPGINTSDPEYFPTITVDGETILFTRRIEDNRVLGPYKQQEDFFVSNLSENQIWLKAVPMPPNVNTVNNEGAPTLSADGRSLIFVACPDATGENYGENRYGRGSCDLFYTKRIGKLWTNPKNLPGGVNTSNWETQPSLSSDGKTLYFIRGVRNRDGSKSSDIYTSTLQEDGTWSNAVALPSTVNSPLEEESVLIHPDGRTLYFGSKGHVGMGGTDLFVSRMDAKGNWSKAENLGYPINTRFDEHSLMVAPDGEIAFIASNREGGFGDLDIYHFIMPEHLRPTKTLYFEGFVYDIITKKPIPGKFRLIDLKTGQEIIYSEADELTGEFIVSLPVNREYVLNVSYPNYTFFSKNFNMMKSEEFQAFKMDVPMTPISSELPVVLNNVFFDLSLASLRPESFIELEKLREFLATNPSVKIEIGGHTDSRGNAAENTKLSTDRAKAVYDYLVSKKIDASRLSYKGYGSKNPVISDEKINRLTDPAEIESAHQLNRRTEYKIAK